MLALRNAAEKWLELECNIKLSTGGNMERYDYDDAAADRGRGMEQHTRSPSLLAPESHHSSEA
jgi:hypothetical protein